MKDVLVGFFLEFRQKFFSNFGRNSSRILEGIPVVINFSRNFRRNFSRTPEVIPLKFQKKFSLNSRRNSFEFRKKFSKNSENSEISLSIKAFQLISLDYNLKISEISLGIPLEFSSVISVRTLRFLWKFFCKSFRIFDTNSSRNSAVFSVNTFGNSAGTFFLEFLWEFFWKFVWKFYWLFLWKIHWGFPWKFL